MSHLLKAVRPIVLDFASTIAFAGLMAATHSLPVSVGASLALAVGQIGWQRAKGRPVDLMQWAGLALVLVFGGAALMTHDVRFVLFKPTVIYCAIGAVMLRPGWMNRYAPPIVHDTLPASVLTGWGYVWSGLMFATAAANLGLALNGDLTLWAGFIAIWPLASKLALFAMQYVSLRLQVRRRLVGAGLEAQAA